VKTDFVLIGARVSFASRTSRRWLVALIYAGFSAAEIAWFLQRRIVTPVAMFVGFLCLLALTALTALAGSGYEGGDEREDHRRDHAYFLAHKPLGWVMVTALFAAGLRGIVPLLLPVSPILRVFLDDLPYAVLVAGGILIATLPQAILLRTEPDMEEQQP
jgi:hypothetical protein